MRGDMLERIVDGRTDLVFDHIEVGVTVGPDPPAEVALSLLDPVESDADPRAAPGVSR
jgi:hypothetical protein